MRVPTKRNEHVPTRKGSSPHLELLVNAVFKIEVLLYRFQPVTKIPVSDSQGLHIQQHRIHRHLPRRRQQGALSVINIRQIKHQT